MTHGIQLSSEQAQCVQQAVTAVATQGYAVIPGFLDAQRLATVRGAMEHIFTMTSERDASKGGRCIGLTRDIWLNMPERLQRLLGMQKVNFLYGSVDYIDPLTYFRQHPDSLAT